jgi:CheY-like chemotaxis protein
MATASILIVDDNPVNLRVLRAFLNRADYEVIAAENGLSALGILKSNPIFDLVLLDVMMPDISGIEVCRQLKADPGTSHIPIVLISAQRVDEKSIAEGLQAGADGYLTQPIEEMALRAWVKATLRISQLHRELRESTPAPDSSQREIIGRFAELSHKVNNPMQALYAAAELLMLETDGNPQGTSLVTDILQQAERITRLVAEESLLAKQLLGH